MNDDEIIQRLRDALDEVADAPAGDTILVTPHVRESFGPNRWMAVAAAMLLIGLATVVLVQRSGSSNDDKAGPASTPASNPATTGGVPSTTGTPRSTLPVNNTAWYALDLAGFTPGPATFDTCCKPWPAPGPDLTMAWGDVQGIDHGLLILRVHRSATNGAPVLTYAKTGMSVARMESLEKKVVEGSGLPYVLPDPSMQLLGNGLAGDGNLVSQTWTSGGDTVSLSVGDYRMQLEPLTQHATWTTTHVVTGIAYRIDDETGTTFIWQTPVGTWATLHTTIGLSQRIDEILAALVPARLPTEPAQSTTTTVDTGTSPSGVVGTLSLARTGLDARVSSNQTTGSGWFVVSTSADPANATSTARATLTWSQQSAPTGEAAPSFRVGDQLRWTARDGSVTTFTVTSVVLLPANGGGAVGDPTTALQLNVQEIDATPTLVFARRG